MGHHGACFALNPPALCGQTVYTDHSLVELDLWPSAVLNRVLEATLHRADACIAVSNARSPSEWA